MGKSLNSLLIAPLLVISSAAAQSEGAAVEAEPAAGAEVADALIAVPEGAEVVITGSRERVRVLEAPRAVSAVDRAAIDRAGALGVVETLAAMPGVSLSQTPVRRRPF